MAFFSSHYNTSGTTENGVGAFAEELPIADPAVRISAGLSHSRVRRSHAKISFGSAFGVGEVGRVLTLKSSDRLYSLLVSFDGGATAADADLGIYLSGSNHDGALPAAACVDAFSSTAIVVDTAANRVESFELGDYDTENIGLQMWELVNITAAATYTADPKVDFDICFTVTVAATDTVAVCNVEAFYTSNA
jgi:hypothetical protein